MLHIPREIIEFEKLENGTSTRCRVEVFLERACIVEGDTEIIFESAPDFREQAIRHLEGLGYVRVAAQPADWACAVGDMETAAVPIDPGQPPKKCPSPDCGDWSDFDFAGVGFQYGAVEDPGVPRAANVAPHRVAKWKCRKCGCQIQLVHRLE